LSQGIFTTFRPKFPVALLAVLASSASRPDVAGPWSEDDGISFPGERHLVYELSLIAFNGLGSDLGEGPIQSVKTQDYAVPVDTVFNNHIGFEALQGYE